jgi:hypothetical protein
MQEKLDLIIQKIEELDSRLKKVELRLFPSSMVYSGSISLEPLEMKGDALFLRNKEIETDNRGAGM